MPREEDNSEEKSIDHDPSSEMTDSEINSQPIPPEILDSPGPVTFERVYREILEPKCSRCHSGVSAEDFVDVTDLEGMKSNFMYPDLIVKGNPAASRIYRAVESGRMPRRDLKLSSSELALMRLWIFEDPDL